MEVTLKAKKGSGHLAKKLPATLKLDAKETANGLQELISKSTGTSVTRIRLSLKSDKPAGPKKNKDLVLQGSDVLASFAVDGNLEVFYRDLGPQIRWRTVFLIEYLGPLLIHPIFMHFRSQIYGSGASAPTQIQQIVYVCVMLHFIKRELETAFVHKFSLATMPVFNLFKNCAHYWLLSGVLVAYFCYAPESWWTGNVGSVQKLLYYSGGLLDPQTVLFWALPFNWLVSEVSNFVVHLNLASLRPSGSTERKIPYGYGFERVSCPNYYFESLGWLMLSVICCNWAMALFTVVGTAQMYAWAHKKHKRYLAEFPDYPKNRKAMFPFFS